MYFDIDGYEVHPIQYTLDVVSNLQPKSYNISIFYYSNLDYYEAHAYLTNTDPTETAIEFTGKTEKEARFRLLLALLYEQKEKASIR